MTLHNLAWINCMKIKLSTISEVPLTDIDGEDRLTDFSLDGCPEKLMDSIKEIGIRHPISVCPTGNRYIIVSGHKRFQAAPKCGLTHIPVVITSDISNADRLFLNLAENFGHRHYSDIEKGIILNKFNSAEIPEAKIIDLYMPLLELERSKKRITDYFSVKQLSPGLQKLLHNANVPLKTFRIFYRWNAESKNSAENLFSKLKPGINKWRELLELIEETAHRDNNSPAQVINNPFISATLLQPDLTAAQKYEKIHQHLYNLRFPVLSQLKKQVARTLDEMALDDKTRLKFHETFESNEFKLELKFQNERELSQQVEKIFQALQSGSVEKLTKIFTL